ncbi:MAG: hypothetical protein M1347_04880 [Chloroflexi bacterium]|nr:hypothetical protein [Chloroflexota bacterium]
MPRLIILFGSLLVILFLVSCGSAPSLESLAVTAEHMAGTGVALTLTAAPTSTPIPSATFTATSAPTQIQTPAIEFPTTTATVFIAVGTQANALPTAVSAEGRADKSDSQTYLLLQNNTDQVIWFIIDSPIYLEYRFSDTFGILIPQGDYHYRAYIGSKGPIEGSFHIGNQDKHTLAFTAGKVLFQGP